MDRIAVINPDAPGEIIENLIKMDIEPILIPKTGLVDGPLAGHPDIQIFVHGDRIFCHPDISVSFVNMMEKYADVTLCSTPLTRAYPADVPYNIACAGQWAFRHSAGSDPGIEEYLRSKKIAAVGVSQGYAKCSTLIVDDNSIITADMSIHRAATSRGVESLPISAGHIDLPGYRYGFIGGATGMWDNMVLCAGTLEQHPDYSLIEDFVVTRGKKIVPLGRMPAVDLGTIFVL
ncbi:MAG TPA: hypothetical protein PLM53_02305 [Spirochaetota bacterium]|nr:hypothetical protein [Spirochaetota bacterium]HPC43226.1 hypothetical protein [Spirochaetota bacterium]HPL16534.1 hypothetical protein [Spirochaetota bacterium]HQF06693.1 hypothetical protein [Spirochaetota bacterium]HQH95904.1 hypothetical protein [Spirochaetota bacterium]